MALQKQGNLKEAEALYRDTLERRRRNWGDDNIDTISSMESLANVLHQEDNEAERHASISEASSRRQRKSGDLDSDTVSDMRVLADIIVNEEPNGDLLEAETLQREAVERMMHTLRGGSPDTLPDILDAKEALAFVVAKQGDLAQAEDIERDALERSRRILGAGNLKTVFMTNCLAATLGSQGRFQEAKALEKDVCENAMTTEQNS